MKPPMLGFASNFVYFCSAKEALYLVALCVGLVDVNMCQSLSCLSHLDFFASLLVHVFLSLMPIGAD